MKCLMLRSYNNGVKHDTILSCTETQGSGQSKQKQCERLEGEDKKQGNRGPQLWICFEYGVSLYFLQNFKYLFMLFEETSTTIKKYSKTTKNFKYASLVKYEKNSTIQTYKNYE